MKHAYPKGARELPVLENQWWLLGYRDIAAHEIWFCFYDQGASIPGTIRSRFSDLFRSDEDILEEAVLTGGFSRTKLAHRGKGLPSLFDFVKEGRDGSLSIVTNKSRCIFNKVAALPTLTGGFP